MSGLVLNTFSNTFKDHFPMLARVSDVKEVTSVLHNHKIKVGSELAFHGWVKQSKVLAFSKATQCYAIPLTYRGEFRVNSRYFPGVSELMEVGLDDWVRVISLEMGGDSPLVIGNVVRVVGGDVESDVVVMEHKHGRVVEVPMSTKGVFVELVDDSAASGYSSSRQHTIKELSAKLTNCDLEVEVVKGSDDLTESGVTSIIDLPLSCPLLLTDLISEQSVLASSHSLANPVFQIPLRTLLYVQMVKKLDKASSPFARKQKALFSTLDRCLEVLPMDVFSSLRPPQRAFETFNFWLSAQQLIRSSKFVSARNLKERSGVNNCGKETLKNSEGLTEIPIDGNLYELTTENFMEVLKCLRIRPEVLQKCSKLGLDGRKFERLSSGDLFRLDLNHPVLNHFRENTFKVR